MDIQAVEAATIKTIHHIFTQCSIMGQSMSTGILLQNGWRVLVQAGGEIDFPFIYSKHLSILNFLETMVFLLRPIFNICIYAIPPQRNLASDIQPSLLEPLLTDPSHTKLAPTYYKTLLHSMTTRICTTENKWRSDILELTEDIWIVIQTKLLYRSYFTPCLLYRLKRLPSEICSKCGMADGIFSHLMWEWSLIRKFW